MKIINPLSTTKKKEHIADVLYALAGQNNCDGEPYDQMQEAANYILELEAKILLITSILKDLQRISEIEENTMIINKKDKDDANFFKNLINHIITTKP